MDEKSMQFANFNITFGENDAPMLKHFSDIISSPFLAIISEVRETAYQDIFLQA